MKRTLLDLTQNILSALDSDEVNSISDTTESLQVAETIKTVYFNILSRSKLPVQSQLFQLTSSNDATQPVLMYRPDNIAKIESVKYYDSDITNKNYNFVTILPTQQFLDTVEKFNLNELNVQEFTFALNTGSYRFRYKTDRNPRFCTILQNYYVIFDSFNTVLDTTLQASKTECFGEKLPVFLMQDTYIPELDDKQFPLLLNEAKSLAFLELKQMSHPKAEQESKRQWSSMQRDKFTADSPSYFDQLPDFGRRASRFTSRFKAYGWR
jgi:hypothetical protein